MHSGVNTNITIKPAGANAGIVFRRVDIKDKKIILYVGRFAQVKNLPLLLNAFSMIDKKDVRLVMVGDGPMRDDIERIISDLELNGKVILTGALYGDDLYAWYRIADYFVLPSSFEPFGAVVLHPVAAEVPPGFVVKKLSDAFFVEPGLDVSKCDGLAGFVFALLLQPGFVSQAIHLIQKVSGRDIKLFYLAEFHEGTA